MYDIIVVGAGLAGCVIAERFASQEGKKVLLIEQRDHVGGNCYDQKDEHGILIHRYGPHLFHTDDEDVWSYLSSFTSWEPYEHCVLACIDGRNVPIPFNLHTLYQVFPEELAKKIEEKLLETFPYGSKIPILELKKSSDPDLELLADFVYEKIFVNYTAKQWGMKPEEMDSAVTARVPIFVGHDNRYFNDRFQGVPKDGYTKMVEKMVDHPLIEVRLNTQFHNICELSGGHVLCEGEVFKGEVFYTGAIDELFHSCFGELPYRSVDMQFETLPQRFFQEAATINYPNEHAFTRITEFKHIHPIESSKTTILKEYPQEHISGKTTPYYPIFTQENQARYEKYATYAHQYATLTFVGRLAEYKYYDMDDIVKRALTIFDSRSLPS